MRKALLFLLVLAASHSHAQIVNIPDQNFKNALLNYTNPVIDINHDGEIQVSEAAVITQLSVDFQNISDLTGILSFTNLAVLAFPYNQVTSVNLSGLSHLTQIACQQNQLTNLNLSGLVNLNYLDCSNNNLSTLNVSGLTGLLGITCSDNSLTGLDLTGLTNLSSLVCNYNQLTSLNISGLNNLNSIYCYNNNLASLTLSNCPLLQYLICNFNQLTSLDLSNGLNNLSIIQCNQNQLSSLNLSGLTNLQQAYFNNNQLTAVNLNGLNNLTDLGLSNNLLTTADISGCRLLHFVSLSNNQLTYVNLKNGPTICDDVILDLNPDLHYVCVDDAEVSSLQAFLITQGLPGININSYCNFTPGGTYNTINGTMKMDMNNNGCDAGDPVIPQLIVKISDGTNIGYTSTNSLGAYSFYANAGNFTITPQTQNSFFTITPASASINFASAGGNAQTANFCFAPNGTHNDLDITLIPVSRAKPGFDATYKLVYKNKGTTTLSGNVELGFDDAKMDLFTTNPVTTTQGTGLLSWAYSNLQPFESRAIDIVFDILPPPTNNIDDSLSFTGDITPVVADETAFDNSFELKQVVTGSFDPNDKTCLEGKTFDVTRVGDYAHYLIRFQNTGTDVAENIVVKDILQTNFNWNSLQIVSTSHPCVVKQTLGNKIEFIFQGINLPAQSIDEPGSHGYIAFKIKTLPSLVLGDSLKNAAFIYFDFNFPVITNLAGSVVGETGTIPISIEYLKGNIQSGKHLLNWKANCTSLQATFEIERSVDARKYNSIGSITASNTRCLQPFDFIDNDPAAGINYYRIKMIDIDGRISYSSTIALLNKKTGFEIVNLLSNPVIGGSALLNITSAEKQSINIVVSDASGKIVQSMDQPVISGFTQIKMNFANLAAGMYTITIYTGNGERRTKQFVKQ